MNTIKKSIIILIASLIVITCIILIIAFNRKAEDNRLPVEVQEIQPKEVIEISKNEYNSYIRNNITEDQKVVYILDDFKEKMLYDLEEAYNCLNAEYRELKFGNLDGLKKYIDANRKNIQKLSVYSFQVNNKEGYTQYLIKNEYDKTFLFNETNTMEYVAMMDTYVILLPDSIKKYNESNEQQKVAINIDRFIRAINDKSYYYAYNCLADSFKDNYFKTQADFENYARENFYENSTVEYNQFESQGDIYTYSVILKDKVSGEQKTKTFIMRLGEGTDFEMSFNR